MIAEIPQPLPEFHCPLCGGPNDCAAAANCSFTAPCWCREVTFAAELLARVPEPMKGRACICRACAEAAAAGQGSLTDSSPPMS
ncbi:cysteine-rich CWC family protein [Luteolibacter sp. GHJ8]|uniref:Cysteine-rich CWC family protein n=1 Tax=Luteolibacter rhizosphaerae TaxID=2989719 RepID=A0ABT3GAD0_9BACT|nr:cysteine-rich CWC family protein [Luteolibacter rhizosphaerae]MCW1916584.1 cysteine-rich CWC family protein [Luteolibacter rhizosphaerae]